MSWCGVALPWQVLKLEPFVVRQVGVLGGAIEGRDDGAGQGQEQNGPEGLVHERSFSLAWVLIHYQNNLSSRYNESVNSRLGSSKRGAVKFDFDEFRQPANAGVIDWFRPTGSTVVDGLRLAVINTVFLIALLIVVSISSLLLRLANWVLPFPVIFPVFIVVVVSLVLAAFGWQRYAAAHGRMAMARGNQTRPDVFGVLAALPFIGLALLLVSSGILSLFFAMITFSGGRTFDALVRMLYGVVFALAAAANLIVARAASDG